MLRIYLCVFVALLISPPAFAAPEDLDSLLTGVGSIAAPGAPGPLAVFGGDAFPVIVGKSGKGTFASVVAAGRLGKGRILAFGHNGYLAPEAFAIADTGKLFANAIAWTSRKNDGKPRIGILGNARLANHLRQMGQNAIALDKPTWADELGKLDLLITDGAGFSMNQIPPIRGFLENGGGLITGSLGWGWSQLNPGKSLQTDHPGNVLLAPAGLAWADGMLENTAKDGYDAAGRPGPLVHVAKALDQIEAATQNKAKSSPEELAQASASVTLAAQSVTPGDTVLLPGLNRLVDGLTITWPTPKKSLKANADTLSRLAITLWYQRTPRLAPEQIKPHPAAEAFPGAVPASARRIRKTLAIDLSIPGWHSTGLYAAPGEVVTIRVPNESGKSTLQLRIGSHTDQLWHLDSWRRMPQISSAVEIKGNVTRFASPFGGLVYIEVNRPQPNATVAAEIDGAVESPLFILGKTTNDQWKSSIRSLPGPWAEIQATRVIITVPSEHIRKLDDAEALATFWDQVLDADANLAGIPAKRPRPERYLADVQISAGYMHSGYPIMTHLDVADLMVDRHAMLGNKREPVWGLFHEMGHNHQSGLWTFEGTGEVTCNLFSRYCLETVCGIPTEKQGKSNPKAVESYLKSGGNWERWKSDPFLALAMYDQLKSGFGWETYKKVLAEYRQIPRSQRPRTEQEKRDQWMIRFSKAVGKNLGPFFTAWGVPVSEEAKLEVRDLPVWFPDAFPGK